MYYKNCGKEIRDDAAVCIHCGTEVKKTSSLDGTPKTGLGVLLALFLGVIGLIIGICLYPADTVERKTFMKGWGVTFAISIGIIFILYMTVFASTCALLASY